MGNEKWEIPTSHISCLTSHFANHPNADFCRRACASFIGFREEARGTQWYPPSAAFLILARREQSSSGKLVVDGAGVEPATSGIPADTLTLSYPPTIKNLFYAPLDGAAGTTGFEPANLRRNLSSIT